MRNFSEGCEFYPALDVMRVLAAIGVLAAHCALLVPFGWLGVPFFLVLSGFLGFRSMILGKGTGDWLIGRVLRIFPLYFFYLSFLTVLLLVFPLGDEFFQLLPSLVFGYYAWMSLFGWEGVSMWFAQFWTLSVQLQFWLLLPLFLFLVRGAWRPRVLWALVLLTPFFRVGVHALAEHLNLDPLRVVYGNPLSYVDALALGGLAFLLPRWTRKFAGKVLFLYVVVLGALALLLGQFTTQGVLWFTSLGFPWLAGEFYQWIWGYSLLHLLFFLLLRWVISLEFKPFTLWLSEFFVWFSPYTYGLYVFHLPVVILTLFLYGFRDISLEALYGRVPWSVFFWSFGVSFVLAVLGRHLVEVPVLRAAGFYRERIR